MSRQGRSSAVSETWKPQCQDLLEMPEDFYGFVRYDTCQRKQRHRTRHVGRTHVWDRNGNFDERLNK
jgi:hypothetical protein